MIKTNDNGYPKYAMKLHLGAFDKSCDGWINTDITPHLFIARIPFLTFFLYKLRLISKERYLQHKDGVFSRLKYLNVTRKFPYPNNSIDVVFCSHLLEHLYPDEAIFCLRQVYRVLRKNGIFRIAIPDLDSLIQKYDCNNPDEFVKSIYEAQNRKHDIKNSHHWQYNSVSITQKLKDAGFSEVCILSYKVGQCPDIDKLDNRPESSIFIETVK
jgi:SAM-dependent methyltransferase